MIASKVRPEATTGSVLLKKAPLKFYEIETPVTESLFKSSCRPQAQLFAANFVKFFEIFYVANVLLWQWTFLIDWCLKRLKSTIYLLLFYREHFHGFSESDLWKCRKKKTFISQQTYQYRPFTYTGHWHFEVLWIFILHIL